MWYSGVWVSDTDPAYGPLVCWGIRRVGGWPHLPATRSIKAQAFWHWLSVHRDVSQEPLVPGPGPCLFCPHCCDLKGPQCYQVWA